MNETWPELPAGAWEETRATLHMWTQIVGKIQLALSPFLNQWWNVALTLTARGLTTGPVPNGDRTFDMEFDFIAHQLRIRVSDGGEADVELAPKSVAAFYQEVMQALAGLNIGVTINPHPSEVADGIPFDQDTTHAAYDGAWVQRWWRVMLGVERVIEQYRVHFHGKSSPAYFYWGGFDLSATRFNGRPAPVPAGASNMYALGENEENIAVGFWPGAGEAPAALYAYVVPAHPELSKAGIEPEGAFYDEKQGEFFLPYEVARQAPNPAAAIGVFFQSAYEAAAEAAGWDRSALEDGDAPSSA